MLSVLVSLGMSSLLSSGSTLAGLACGKPAEAAHKTLTEPCPATNLREMAAWEVTGWVGDRRGKRWGAAGMLRAVWGQGPSHHGQWVHVHRGTQQHLHPLKFGPLFGWGEVTLQPTFMRKRRCSLSALDVGLGRASCKQPPAPRRSCSAPCQRGRGGPCLCECDVSKEP